MQNQEIKGNLARLLATENLVVEHRKVSTASFDVDRRVLTLPNWDRASSVVYDMLVGHEVGHALFTPNTDWRELADCPMDFVNVIEDARIEKLMKRKFPGLRKSFAGGYKELNDQDFFGILDEDLAKLSLIDRINLHFKVGASALIPFSIEEKVFVARTDVAETFEEVCEIAVDVYEFSKEEKVQEPEQENLPTDQQQDSGEGMTHEEMLDEANKRESQNSEEEGNANETSEIGGQSSQKQEGDDDGDDEFEDDEPGAEGSETQSNFDRAAEQLSSRFADSSNKVYVEIPEDIKTSDIVVDWKVVHDWIDQNRSNRPDVYENVDKSYMEFRKQSQKEVNYLVKEFECRKSADAYARAGQSKTGVLDTTKLHTYKYSDDIFKKMTILPDGKNHGLLFILDWSGSMGNELLATVKQLINLTTFCKKVQIPFEVYAFTNEWFSARRVIENIPELSNKEFERRRGIQQGKIHIDKLLFDLINFVSSRSNARDYERMCLNLYREAYAYRYYVEYHTTPGLSLSGTPLNESIISLNYILPEFKKNNDLQKVNVCILSDGEGCGSAYGGQRYNDYKDEYYTTCRRLDYNTVLRDRKTGHVYSNFGGGYGGGDANIFIDQLKNRFPEVNVIGFRILSGKDLSSFVHTYAEGKNFSDVQRQWKKEKSAIIPFPKSFTALFAIANNSMGDNVEFEVESGAKKSDITKAFKKMLNKKSSNKKLLSAFIGQVC